MNASGERGSRNTLEIKIKNAIGTFYSPQIGVQILLKCHQGNKEIGIETDDRKLEMEK